MFLDFEITDQTLTRLDKNSVVTDSVDYLKAKFTFKSDEWTDTVKSAIFKAGNKCYTVLLDDNGECIVPYEVLTQTDKDFVNLSVSVFGVNATLRITTNKKTIRLDVSGYTLGATPEDPAPDVYSEILKNSKEAVDKADEVFKKAENGEFNGKDGANGVRPTKTVEITESHGLALDATIFDNKGFLIGCYSEPLDDDGNILIPIGTEIKTIELYVNNENKFYSLEEMITVDNVPYVLHCYKIYFEKLFNYFTFATVHFIGQTNTFLNLIQAFEISKIRVTYYTD